MFKGCWMYKVEVKERLNRYLRVIVSIQLEIEVMEIDKFIQGEYIKKVKSRVLNFEVY